MSREEQVNRVLAAMVVQEHDGEKIGRWPLIATGELYFTSEEQVIKFVRRILAAANGTIEFTDHTTSTTAVAKRQGAHRNPAGAEAYRQHKLERNSA